MNPSSQLLKTSSKIDSFLQNTRWHTASYSFLAGDASLRTYYRLGKETDGAVLMEAPPPENPALFCQISKFLKNLGCSAPSIFSFDPEKGLVLLEDFGDLTFSKALIKGANALDLYTLAVDALIYLQHSIEHQPSFIHAYSPEEFVREALIFLEWYWPWAKQKPPSAEEKTEYKRLWTVAFQDLTTPKTLVLRDFHVDNLMVLPNRTGPQKCGFLDFQDALWGPLTYDLVSLLEDARTDVSPDLVQFLWSHYCKAFPHLDSEMLQKEGCILSAGRHAKILGVFTRLAVRDNKTHYLNHLPRIWRLLRQCLENPVLKDLQNWFNFHFPFDEKLPCS